MPSPVIFILGKERDQKREKQAAEEGKLLEGGESPGAGWERDGKLGKWPLVSQAQPFPNPQPSANLPNIYEAHTTCHKLAGSNQRWQKWLCSVTSISD